MSNYKRIPGEAKVFEVPAPSKTTWDDIFSNPSPITSETIDTGGVKVKKSSILNLKSPKVNGLTDEILELRVYSHIIRSKEHGNFLIDAGLHSSVHDNPPYGNLKGLIVKFYNMGYSQEKGEDILTQLQKREIKINGVFLTHLHNDHISGLPGLPSDTDVFIGIGEIYHNYKFLYSDNSLNKFNKTVILDFSKAKVMYPFGPAIDIFGDSSFWAISTPGHSQGHVSYLVNGSDGPALFTGDACVVKYGLENHIGPGTYSADVEAAQKTFDKIYTFHKAYPNVKIYFGHQLP